MGHFDQHKRWAHETRRRTVSDGITEVNRYTYDIWEPHIPWWGWINPVTAAIVYDITDGDEWIESTTVDTRYE